MKNRNLGVILSLAVFLAAQALGIAHAAAFGPGKHKHHGHICDIHLSTDQAKAAAPSPPFLHVPSHSGFTFVPPVSIEFLGEKYPSASPRAPPAALLS